MNTTYSAQIAAIRSYLSALQAGETGPALAAFFTDDAVQIELPNRLNPNGGRSDLPTLLTRAEQGRQLLVEQHYEIVSVIEDGNKVAVEARWNAVIAVPIGTLPAGAMMNAHFAMFFEMVDGRIKSQRNYDCFEPW